MGEGSSRPSVSDGRGRKGRLRKSLSAAGYCSHLLRRYRVQALAVQLQAKGTTELFQKPKRIASLFEPAIYLVPVALREFSGRRVESLRAGDRHIDAHLVALSLMKGAVDGSAHTLTHSPFAEIEDRKRNSVNSDARAWHEYLIARPGQTVLLGPDLVNRLDRKRRRFKRVAVCESVSGVREAGYRGVAFAGFSVADRVIGGTVLGRSPKRAISSSLSRFLTLNEQTRVAKGERPVRRSERLQRFLGTLGPRCRCANRQEQCAE